MAINFFQWAVLWQKGCSASSLEADQDGFFAAVELGFDYFAGAVVVVVDPRALWVLGFMLNGRAAGLRIHGATRWEVDVPALPGTRAWIAVRRESGGRAVVGEACAAAEIGAEDSEFLGYFQKEAARNAVLKAAMEPPGSAGRKQQFPAGSGRRHVEEPPF